MALESFKQREFPPVLDRHTQMSHDFMVKDAAYDLRNAPNEAVRINKQQRLTDLNTLRMLTYSYSKYMNEHLLIDKKNPSATFLVLNPDAQPGQESVSGKLRRWFVNIPDLNGQLRIGEAERLFALAIERAEIANRLKLHEERKSRKSF